MAGAQHGKCWVSEAAHWRAVMDLVWQGEAVPEACERAGLDYPQAWQFASPPLKNYLVELSMVANCRDHLPELRD